MLLVTACSDGDGERAAPAGSASGTDALADATDGGSSTATSSGTGDATATSDTAGTPDGDDLELGLSLSAPQVWASTRDADVCSPVEPSSSRLEVRSSGEVALVGVVMTMPGGGRRHQVLAPGADGVWFADIGPFRARRTMTDGDLDLTVAAFDAATVAEFGLDLVGLEPADLDGIDPSAVAVAIGDDATGGGAGASADIGVDNALAALTEADLAAVQLADVEIDLDRATVSDSAAITILAPTACRSGQTRDPVIRSRDVPDLGIELVGGDAAALWASGAQVCLAGPTTASLSARTTGRVDGVRMRWTLPNGAIGTKVMRRGSSGDGSWTADLGPFTAAKNMPDTSDISVTITARDAGGNEVEVSTVVSILRPAACDDGAASSAAGASGGAGDAATSSTSPGSDPSVGAAGGAAGGGTGDGTGGGSTTSTAGAGADTAVVVDATVGVGEIWATAEGLCTGGPTTATVEARIAGEVDGVQARTTFATGAELGSVQLSSRGNGLWRATIGPVAADRNMPASSVLTVRVTARRGERSGSDSITLTLRRPTVCASGTTVAPGGTTAPTTATTTAPTTPTTPTTPPASSTPPPTTSPSTTAPPPPPPPTTAAPTTVAPVALTIDGRAGSGEISAAADGLCAASPTSVSLEARTTGAAADVQVRAVGSNGSVLATVSLSNQGGVWRGTLGPIAGQRDMPDSSPLTLQFGVRGPGGNPAASDSVTITLRRPVACG